MRQYGNFNTLLFLLAFSTKPSVLFAESISQPKNQDSLAQAVPPLETPQQPSVGNFMLSLGIGATVGLGLGHAVQGRYGEEGGFFTISEIGALIVMGAGLIECLAPGDYLFFKSPGFTPTENAGCRLIKGGSLTFIGLKIFEVLDLFQGIPVWHRLPEKMTLNPILFQNQDFGIAVGLKF